ncbi:MAG TPA: sugar ABC transporter ATP-binding protein [Bryobacteraceae bacterium]|nr:sugar ABC transporter ATP-binding protein [Bryobacteraceae bacterium]
MSPNVILEARGVSMQYPGTLALDNVTFQLRKGMVSALIGENGAGKSTLVKILAGIAQPTSGSLFLEGAEIALRSVRDADAQGIGIIHQELNLCPNLSVAENIFLAREISSHGVLNRREQEARARELLERLEQPIHPRTLVGDLPLGQQQIVEIVKALARNVRVLMMDEPTSALSAYEIEILFRIIADLKARGVAIVYISHRLEELLRVADTVSVLRDGRMVGEGCAADVDTGWLVERMTGRSAAPPEAPPQAETGREVLRVERLSLVAERGRRLLDDVSLSVRSGEVLGIYGLMGAGRTELMECLMGLHPEVVGSVFLGSRKLDHLDTASRIDCGLAMVPEDRQAAGLVQSLSVLSNMTLSSLGRFSNRIWISAGAEESAAARVATELRLKTPGLKVNIGTLSGGNQQKAVIAKCLLTRPRVLLLDEPTRGVDVGAKREIQGIVRRLARSGMAVVLASSELEEVRATADRIIVMSRGSVSGEFLAAEASDDSLAIAASSEIPQKGAGYDSC